MRRSIKKAVAFTLAAVTMFANLSVTAPVKAAEYGEVKEILPNKYKDYRSLGDSVVFYNEEEILLESGYSSYRITDIVIVNENGEKTVLETKNADGTYIYYGIDTWSKDALILFRADGTEALYYLDGTWIGNGKDKYEMISSVADNQLAVVKDGKWSLLDESGKILVENFYEDTSSYCIHDLTEFGDYIVVEMGPQMGAGGGKVDILDKNYKKVSSLDLTKYFEAKFADDRLLVYNYEEVACYDSKLQKLFSYKVEKPENPSPSAEKVLVDSNIYASMYKDLGVFVLYVDLYYENLSGEYEPVEEVLYYDIKTFEPVSEDKVNQNQKDDELREIKNTDLTCKNDDDMSMYYGTKKVADIPSIKQYVCEKRSASSCEYIGAVGYNGDLYFNLNASGKCVLVLEKASGYSLDKAKILDLKIRDTGAYMTGYMIFEDGTAYLNSKVYEKVSYFNFFSTYNKEEKKDVVHSYVVTQTETKGDKTENINTLYDKYNTEMYKTKDDIWYVTSTGIIVTCAKDEKGDYKLGCKSIEKTLVNSQDILDELVTAEEGDTIEVELKKNDPVKAEVFETIKGKDVNVVLNLDNGMSWKINGKNVKGDKLTDINLTVDVVKDVVPAKAIDKVNLKGERIELSLAHTGEFGFSAELTMNVKKENAGKFANRFYYNPETKELEFQEAVKIDANGDATFTYTHASDYVIILSDVSYETMAGKPGDMANIGMLVALLGTAGAAMFVFQKKRDLVK